MLTSGGSLANLTAIIAARRPSSATTFRARTLYCGDQTHHAFQKAAVLAGFPAANIREIPSDATFRVRVDALADAIARDRADGFTPFMLCGSAGTTPTGAVDDLAALGATGAPSRSGFTSTARTARSSCSPSADATRCAASSEADSIILDPHKTLFLPFGTGALVVRDASVLRRAYSIARRLPAAVSGRRTS